jgi:hypothetical protein
VASLHQTKCFNHAGREAVARCPLCHNFFCRECVTEHDGRLICATCLAKPEEAKEHKPSRILPAVGNALKASVGLLLAWLVFYAIGQILLMVPDSFHSGDIWSAL